MRNEDEIEAGINRIVAGIDGGKFAGEPGVRKLSAELETLALSVKDDADPIFAERNAVMLRAVGWWANRRPLKWDLRTHIERPLVNMTSDSEIALAKAVAALMKRIGEVTT